jgi:hypothetical protein
VASFRFDEKETMTKSELQIFAEQTFPLSFAHNPKVDVEELMGVFD